MVAIVRLALSRPYTFAVMALLILIFGTISTLRTPTDIFPDIKIPVIAVIWNYTGLPPDDMSGRIISIYERSLTTTVNDIEHIESQSLAGYGIVKIFFQPNASVTTANAQVTAVSQTVLKQRLADIALNTIRPQLITVPGAASPFPYGGKSRGLAATDQVIDAPLETMETGDKIRVVTRDPPASPKVVEAPRSKVPN